MLRSASRLAQILFLAVLVVGIQEIPVTQAQERATYDVGEFTQISVATAGTLYVRQGDAESLEIEAQPDVLERIDVSVENGELQVRDERDSGWLSWLFGASEREAIDVYVTAPTIENISFAGSGDIIGETPIQGESLELEVAGSGTADLDLEVEHLRVRMAGSGTFHLRGIANETETEIAGSGTIYAEDLESHRSSVNIAGSGDAHVHAHDHLSATIMGSGDVLHRGNPDIETNIQGSGEVRTLE